MPEPEEHNITQRIRSAIAGNGSNKVTHRTFYTTLGILCGVAITSGWAVLKAHAEQPHAGVATKLEVEASETRVKETVDKAEENLGDRLDKQYAEQTAQALKLDRIINLMIEDARARSIDPGG